MYKVIFVSDQTISPMFGYQLNPNATDDHTDYLLKIPIAFPIDIGYFTQNHPYINTPNSEHFDKSVYSLIQYFHELMGLLNLDNGNLQSKI